MLSEDALSKRRQTKKAKTKKKIQDAESRLSKDARQSCSDFQTFFQRTLCTLGTLFGRPYREHLEETSFFIQDAS